MLAILKLVHCLIPNVCYVKASTLSDPKCWLCLKLVQCLIPNVGYVKASTLSDPKCWLCLKPVSGKTGKQDNRKTGKHLFFQKWSETHRKVSK